MAVSSGKYMHMLFHQYWTVFINIASYIIYTALSAGTVEYTDCTPAEE